MHPQDNGTLLYVTKNALYKVDTLGNIRLVKEKIANTKPSFKFSGNSVTIWGVWQDNAKNIYVAVFSDQSVKKIDANGSMTDVYKSKGDWAPLHGVFDKNNKLWILESSDKNEIRTKLAEATPVIASKTNSNWLAYIIISSVVLGVVLFFLKYRGFISAQFIKTGH